jgi:creatinine amidohydrolase/Fe(II)-dependent formamide hydrolase-like protein
MKVEVVKALPMLVRLLPVLLALLILAVGVAEADGPRMPPDTDPF